MNDKPENVKVFLQSVREVKAEIRFYRREESRLRELTESVTSRWSAEPGGGTGDKRKDGALAALADMTAKTDEKIAEGIERMQEVSAFIETIEEPSYRCILHLRYVDCCRWPKVQRGLETAGFYYSERAVYYLHGRALRAAQRKWEEREKDEDR